MCNCWLCRNRRATSDPIQVTVNPALGAASARVTVTCAGLPPVTLDGLRLTLATLGVALDPDVFMAKPPLPLADEPDPQLDVTIKAPATTSTER